MNKADMSLPVIGFEPESFKELRAINLALFGDGSHLTPDKRRDLANRMQIVLDRAIETTYGIQATT